MDTTTSGAVFLFSAFSRSSIVALRRIREIPDLKFIRCISVDSPVTKTCVRKLGILAVPCILIKHYEMSKTHMGFEVDVWIDSFVKRIAQRDEPAPSQDFGDPRRGQSQDPEFEQSFEEELDAGDFEEEEEDEDSELSAGGGRGAQSSSRESSRRSKALNSRMADMMNERKAIDDAANPRPPHARN